MTARKLKNFKGFTLVELLIVIAILGIIALIVIAAINPIEQANRARDTGMKADASQLVSAIERYFAARNKFPWVVQDSATYTTNDAAFPYVSADDYHVGLCADPADGGCDANGILIEEEELKPEFRNRRFIQPAQFGDSLVLGKAGQDQSIYACYIPSAESNRSRACDEGLVFTLNTTTAGVRDSYDCTAGQPTWVGSGVTDSYWVCVPE